MAFSFASLDVHCLRDKMKTAKLPPTRSNGHAKVEKAVSKSLAEQVQEDMQSRAKACIEKIGAALKEHRCELHVLMITVNGQRVRLPIDPSIVALPPS